MRTDVLREQQMGLCGVLAAEYQTLPPPMQVAVIRFFDENAAWLTRVVILGSRERTLQFVAVSWEVAHTILSTLEGAILVARPNGDVLRFEGAWPGDCSWASGHRRPNLSCLRADLTGPT